MTEQTMEKTYTLILALIFVLHSIEEFFSYERAPVQYFNLLSRRLNNPSVFFYAIILLDTLVVLIVLLNWFFSNTLLDIVVRVIFFSLFINTLQHILGSFWFKRILPGTYTATFLILPFSVACLMGLHENMRITLLQTLLYLALSPLAMFASIYSSLWLGYFLVKISFQKRT
jgi:hypothetical protein